LNKTKSQDQSKTIELISTGLHIVISLLNSIANMADIAQRPLQQNLPKQPKQSSLAGPPQAAKKKATEVAAPASSHVDDIRSQTHEPTENGTQNIDELETVDDEEEGTEAAGSVDEEGRVVDETGKVVGQ
jgi:hypothetical protein